MEHLGVMSWCYGWKEHSRFPSSALALFSFLFLKKERINPEVWDEGRQDAGSIWRVIKLREHWQQKKETLL